MQRWYRGSSSGARASNSSRNSKSLSAEVSDNRCERLAAALGRSDRTDQRSVRRLQGIRRIRGGLLTCRVEQLDECRRGDSQAWQVTVSPGKTQYGIAQGLVNPLDRCVQQGAVAHRGVRPPGFNRVSAEMRDPSARADAGLVDECPQLAEQLLKAELMGRNSNDIPERCGDAHHDVVGGTAQGSAPPARECPRRGRRE